MSPWNQGVPYEQFILVRKRYKNTNTKTFHKKRLLQKISRRHFFEDTTGKILPIQTQFGELSTKVQVVIHKSLGFACG